MPKGVRIRNITPQQDDVIRKCWARNVYGNHAARRASELTGLSPCVSARRAAELGLVFTKERHRWTESELLVVEENAHLTLETIQRKLALGVSPPGVKRTRTAIAGQIHAQRFRTNLDGLDQTNLAVALGTSIDRLIRFRETHMLKGNRLSSLRQACGYGGEIVEEQRPWFYHNDDIASFLFRAKGEIDFRKVDHAWMMGLLEGYLKRKITTGSSRSNAPGSRNSEKLRTAASPTKNGAELAEPKSWPDLAT